MADVSVDSTGWTAFSDYRLQLAVKIPIDSPVARVEEAERLALDRVYNGYLEIRWRDEHGCEQIGLPRGFWQFDYDKHADCLREMRPGGRALYKPEVRERQRKPVNPVDTSIRERATESAPHPANPTPGSDDQSSDHKTPAESTLAEAVDTASFAVSVIDKPKAPVEGTLIATEAADIASFAPSVAPRQWPWVVELDFVGRRTPRAQCRRDLEDNFQPEEILDRTTPDIQEMLFEKTGHRYTRPTLDRALVRKKDRVKASPSGPKRRVRVSPNEPK